jgi:AcrR family transcriptional regulator
MDDKSDTSGTGLPASLEAAWGLRERPSKGPKPGLSLQRIVDTAVQVADTDGLAAVSMSRVAADLGASTMSLYRYVRAKDELLVLMVDTAYGKAPDAAREHDWRAGLRRWATAELTGLRQHPWILHVPLSGLSLVSPNQNLWLEEGLRCLRDTGLIPLEKMSTMLLVTGFVRSWATMSGDISASLMATGTTNQEAMSSFGRALIKLTDPQQFSELHKIIAAGVFDAEDGPDDEYIFGLERILDGIEALIAKRKEDQDKA